MNDESEELTERQQRQVARLLGAAAALAPKPGTGAPSAASIIALAGRPARPAWSGVLARTAPWAIAAAAVFAAVLWRAKPAADPSFAMSDIVTGAAEMATINLGDGSVVRLGPGSRLRASASDSRREVTLDGRAYFIVAKMPNRPFVVHTTAGDATVLGTRFELSTRATDLDLVVVEGRVALSAGQQRVEVSGGEASGVRNRTPLPPKSVRDADKLERWVGKFLVFQSTPMRDAARQIEVMYSVRIRTDSAIAGRTVTATFTDNTVEQVLDVLCSATTARCTSRGGTTVMSVK